MGFNDLGNALLGSINAQYGVPSTSSGNDPNAFNPANVVAQALNPFNPNTQRQYIETGTIRNIRPRNMELIMQVPDVTVLVKKRLFSSLSENYRYDLMNEDEKLFIRASKILFQNKTKAIAAYERLTKLQTVAVNTGIVNDFVFGAALASVDVLNSIKPGLIDDQTQATFDTIRKVKAFSDPNYETTWLVDGSIPYLSSDLGPGTGVIELTNVSSVNCKTSVVFGGGSANLSIEDPYKLMIITKEEIDQAIAAAGNFFNNQSFFKITESQLTDTIQQLREQFAQTRAARGASPIQFITDTSSPLFNQVRAVIVNEAKEIIFSYSGGLVGVGGSVDIDPSAFQDVNGLQGIEIGLFQQIITNTYILQGLNKTTTDQIKNFNEQTNYVRRKMWLHYAGKAIIQPMDVIHIYISSKTLVDDKIEKGLNSSFTGNSTLNSLNNAVNGLESSLDNLSSYFSGGGGQNSYSDIEKNIIAGPDFPSWLWASMRNDFTRQAAGTHVFAGVVNEAPHNYSNGKYTLTVSANDNTTYFTFGQINVNPSVDVFDSDLYDPLTPFKLDFDASSGFAMGELPPLLDENIRLLSSGSVKAKLGRFKGLTIDQSFYPLPNAEQVAANVFRQKLTDPDGFCYRWKEGIGSLTMFGEPHATGTFRPNTAPALTANPFAGQDVMNVLSLLITGQPYNFNNFMRAAITSGALSRNELTNESLSSSYFRGLINDLSKQNQTWGNFMPFKKLIVNESAYQFLASGQFDLSTANRQINSLLEERAKRFDELTTILPQFANNPQFYKVGAGGTPIVDASVGGQIDIASLAKLGADIIQLDSQIQQQQNDFTNHLQSANIQQTDGTLTIFGNDISFDPTITSSSNSLTPDQQTRQRDEFRKHINSLTKRLLWKVKGNEDQNLFVVDDSYDKNYDIQGFEAALSDGLKTFNSTYTTVFEKIRGVAEILGLEVFADSQGHIQVRPPQYNRMPSSVFYDMLRQKKQKGIQIFPDYLESLFINQIEGLTDQLEIVEDEIRIRCAALGATNDNDAEKLLNGSSVGNHGKAQGSTDFVFVTDEITGLLGGKDLRSLLLEANPELKETFADLAGAELNTLQVKISGAVKATVNFDVVKQVSVVNSSSVFQGVNNSVVDTIAKIGARLAQKTNQPAPTLQSLLSNNRILKGSGQSQLDVLNLTEQISQFIAERQYQIKLLANAIRNLDQGIQLNTNSDVGQNYLYPSLNTKDSDLFPEIIEHMIEDENVDDYGLNAGKRYVLTDSRIISLICNERPPPWTVVEVDGQLASGLVSGPSGLQIGNGGNAISTAFAADYDMWRMYGFRGHNAVQVPFLSDPDAQCAPYAVYLLNRARKDIFQAEATVVGNEFIQPGEVYYIEDRDLLYYCESVQHSFTYGGSYTTQLSLRYGHNPGEYIPTMLDIIGKGLYTKKNQSNLVRHVRNGNATGATHIASLALDNSALSASVDNLIQGTYGSQNKTNLTNMMLATSGLLTPTSLGDQVNLEVRIYYNSKQGFSSANSNLQNAANTIKNWVVDPTQPGTTQSGVIPLPSNQQPIDKSRITIANVDLGKDTETRSPSSLAWSLARIVAQNNAAINFDLNNNAQTSTTELQSLFGNVIDIWAVFSSPDQNITQSTTSQQTASQALIDEQNKNIANFNALLKTIAGK